MIQRIQSIWLLIAAACAFAGFKFAFYSGSKLNDATLYELKGTSTALLTILTGAITLLALVTIFLFKKRKLQFWLCVLGIILEACLYLLYYNQIIHFIKGNYALTAIFQPIVILAFLLAIRGINKDAKILKESDRLR